MKLDPNQMAELQVRQQELDVQHTDAVIEADNRKRDRESKERIAALGFAEDMDTGLHLSGKKFELFSVSGIRSTKCRQDCI